MKLNFLKRIISTVLATAMLLGAMQSTIVSVAAADLNNANKAQSTDSTEQKEPTGEDIIREELAARTPVTKDRSAIDPWSQAAIYKDGQLYAQGGFMLMWWTALNLARDAKGEGASNADRSETVEYVLNQDLLYEGMSMGEDPMTVHNKVFTIDLNGCMLYRTDGKGRVLKIGGGSNVTIMDSNPNKKHNGTIGKHDLWKPSQNGTDVISGGIICGGYLKTEDGGGVMVDDASKLTMTGGTIAGNKADVGSGLYIGENCSADLSRGIPAICYNYSAGTSTDGGAVFLRSNSTIVGGYVHHNYADDWGGGVRAKGGNILVKNVIIYANTAEEDGGGLFIERIWTNQTVSVVGCKIVKNTSWEQGGGVYIWDNYKVNMSDCVVIDNTCNESGAGICLSSSVGTPLEISGKMTVRDNFETGTGSNIASNLYIENNNKLIVGKMALGSKVYIRTKKHADSYNGPSKSLLCEDSTTSHLFFFADEINYCVKYQDDPAKPNYRRMYLDKGTRVDDNIKTLSDTAPKLQTTPYKVESGPLKDTTMPLYKGYFEYDLMTTSDFVTLSPFYYSDGYFLEDPTVYNTHLASMSINAAMAAFGRTATLVGDSAYATHFANIKQLFSDIGCADVNLFLNEDYQKKPGYFGEEGRLSTIGVAITQKEIKANGETYTLVPVAIRGAGYESEWASNVSIGTEGEAQGFSDAAKQVYAHVQNYIKNYGLEEQAANGKVKFWVVGYSRAGATANITSKYLVDNYAEVGNQVYGYTFEAPMGGIASEEKKEAYTGNGTYPTIHNTINELDFVTFVAPTQMGFKRYGIDHRIGTSTKAGNGISYDTGSKYYQQRMQMIKQLNAIDPYFKFYDGWEVADINIVLSQLPLVGTNMIDTGEQIWDNPNEEARTMYTFLGWFYERVFADGLLLPLKDGKPDFSLTREYYAKRKPLAIIEGNVNHPNNYAYSEMTTQEAFTTLMYLLMEALTPEQQDQLIKYLIDTGTGILGGLGITFWDKEIFKDFVNVNPTLAALASIFVSFGTSLHDTLKVYFDLIYSWDERSASENAETLDWVMHQLITPRLGAILTQEQIDMLVEALPVVLWFVLNYASYDYEKNGVFTDDGMWGVGTFVNNASTIISYHFPEVNAAWVRSYDSFYNNDLQAYKVDAENLIYEPVSGDWSESTNKLTLTGQAGSSIFYSTDNGESWKLYTAETVMEENCESVLCFSIYRGVKSEIKTVTPDSWSGSLFGNGNIWIVIGGAALIVAACVVALEINRRKKKAAAKHTEQ